MLCLSSIINSSFEVGIYDEVKPVSLVIFFSATLHLQRSKMRKGRKLDLTRAGVLPVL